AGRVTTRAASQESKRSAAAANAGRIQLKFWYDFDSASLSVGLLSAFNLVPPARNQLSNAFVVLNLLPYLKVQNHIIRVQNHITELKSHQQSLKITSPELKITSSELKITSSEFKITSSEFKITSSELKITSSEFKITSRAQNHIIRVQNHIIRVQNHIIRVQNHIIRAQNHIIRVQNHAITPPFPASQRARRQSKIVSYNNDPMWNQNFVFAPVTEDDIRDGSLRVEVLDYDDFNGSESIGEMYPDRLSENHRSAAQRADRGRALPATDFSAAVGRAASSGLTAGALRPTSPTAASDVGFSFGAGSSGGGGGGVVGAPGKKRQLPQVPGGGGGASPFVRIDSPATAAAAAQPQSSWLTNSFIPPHLQHHRSSLGSRHPAPRLMQEDEAGAISDVATCRRTRTSPSCPR
uniref:C2 domain-containing protein n=1 Tax=Macrostomum lignano TaxID=282301 RepID=A0A1I8JML4_9PLAT